MLDKTKKIINETKEKLENINETIINASSNFINEIKDFSVSNIEQKLSYIGYNISKVEISVTLPPRILFQIDIDKTKINQEKEEEVLNTENNNDLIIISKIIKGIKKALNMKDNIKFNSKELKYLEVEISLIPTVKLVYLDI